MRSGLFDCPDELVPSGTFPLTSHFPSPFECLLVSDRDILLFPVPLCTPCLKLHESPREHWPCEVQWLQSPRCRCLLDAFYIAFRISSRVSFPRCCLLKRPVFVAGIEIIVPYVLLDITPHHFLQSRTTGRFSFLDCILHIQSHEKFQWRNGAVPCTHFPMGLDRELLVMDRSTSSHLVSKPCALSFFNWTLSRSLKSRRASPVPPILKLLLIMQAICLPSRNRLSCCAFVLFFVDSPLEVRGQQLLGSTRNV